LIKSKDNYLLIDSILRVFGLSILWLSDNIVICSNIYNKEGLMAKGQEKGRDKGKEKGKPKLTTKEKQDKKKEKAKTKKD